MPVSVDSDPQRGAQNDALAASVLGTVECLLHTVLGVVASPICGRVIWTFAAVRVRALQHRHRVTYDLAMLPSVSPSPVAISRVAARRVRLGLALTGLGVVLAACGPASAPTAGSGSPAEASEALSGSGGTITLSLKEFRITPETVTIKAGTSVTFAARNDGRMVHALVIKGNGINLATKDLAFGPATTETITASLAAGTYTFFCPVGAHANLGMRGTLTVTP